MFCYVFIDYHAAALNLRLLLAVCDVTVLIYTFVFFFDIFHLLTNKLRLKAAFHVHVHIKVDVW